VRTQHVHSEELALNLDLRAFKLISAGLMFNKPLVSAASVKIVCVVSPWTCFEDTTLSTRVPAS